MSRAAIFARNIRPHVQAELSAAASAGENGFQHLERAHILGQASTREHVRVHWHMLRWGWRQRDLRQVMGQVVRLIGAATGTVIGLVPTGNSGGANVSPFRRMPIEPGLAAIISRAQSGDSH